MSGLELTSLVTLIANYIACNIKDDDELALLAAIYTQLGDTLATIVAQNIVCSRMQEEEIEEQE